MNLCISCYPLGYCRRVRVAIVTDRELSNGAFVFDVRSYAYSLRISHHRWHDAIIDLYRDFTGTFINEQGAPVDLNTEVFECPSVAFWFRDNFCAPANANGHVRCEARERFRVAASILRAASPAQAAMWGVRAANDNEKS